MNPKALLNTVKWIALPTKNVSRIEKAASVLVVEGLNFLSKKALDRGDFHEANHNLVALLIGNSVHEHNSDCQCPTDRMMTQDEALAFATRLVESDQAAASAVRPTGFYL